MQTDGTQRADSLHDRKSDAIKRGRELARTKETELVIKDESVVGSLARTAMGTIRVASRVKADASPVIPRRAGVVNEAVQLIAPITLSPPPAKL